MNKLCTVQNRYPIAVNTRALSRSSIRANYGFECHNHFTRTADRGIMPAEELSLINQWRISVIQNQADKGVQDMPSNLSKQRGASPIVVIIVLAIIGIGVYLGFQYIPIKMESGRIDTILDNIEQDHAQTALRSKQDIETRLAAKLNINNMDDMMSIFNVYRDGDGFTIKASYEREMNLIYEKKAIAYDRTVTLE